MPEGYDGPALDGGARAYGLAVLRLHSQTDGPGGSVHACAPRASRSRPRRSGPVPSDVALILHTSGTTSRPKIVPLLQSNLAASARNIGRVAGADPGRPLPERDAAVPHPRADRRRHRRRLPRRRRSGARPGFDALRFFGWMKDARRRPGTPPCRPCIRRSCRAPRATPTSIAGAPPALPALVLGLACRAQVMLRTGRHLRRPGDRGLRHDRGHPPDGLATRCRRARRNPGRSALPPGPRCASRMRSRTG